MYNRALIVLLLVLFESSFSVAWATPSWFYGTVNRVALVAADGGFIVTFNEASLDDCKYRYAYFLVPSLGEGRVRAAYSMALTSIASGIKMGVVIDKDVNGPDGHCNAVGMAADLRT